MPAHVRAADAPEDLWRCNECGWTYPNHHPSAKHRRNHKKQCGKIPGFMNTSKDLASGPQTATTGGSSDDGSSDEEQHRLLHEAQEKNGDLHKEISQSPSPASATDVEQVCSSGNDQTPTLGVAPEAQVSPKIHEEAVISTRSFDPPAEKEGAGTAKGSEIGLRSSHGSAHAVRGQWSCRHCGWAYPNAHPSAKIRRKHKRNCAVAGAGGSSDEASSDEEKSAGNVESPEGNSSGSQSLEAELINGVVAKGTDLSSKDVERPALADTTAQGVSLESDSSTIRVPPHDSRGLEKANFGSSQAVNVDVENIQPADKQASRSIPDASDVPVPTVELLKPNERDGVVTPPQPLKVGAEQVADRKTHVSQPSLPISAEGTVDTDSGKREKSKPALSQSPLKPGTDSRRIAVGSPQPDKKKWQPQSATRAGARGESLSNGEEQSPLDSPEGLVKSRVQIFEKLAGTSPESIRKSVSPTANSASPRLRRSGTQSTPKRDAQSELYEVMSHLRHRGSFMQSEVHEVSVEGS